MATLASATGVPFTPAVGYFTAQATGGSATLLRKGASGAAYAIAGHIQAGQAVDVNNAVAGQVWEFSAQPGVAVRADGTAA